MSSNITLITGNGNKAKEFEALLGFPIDYQKVPLTEIQALKVQDVAASKAKQAYELLRRPVFVDDTGLTVEAWNGLPGAFIAWFLDSVGNDGILAMATSLGSRAASVTTALGYCDDGGVKVFAGTVNGTLATEVCGSNGFGYDPIFIPDGHTKTFAEMTADEKNLVSMRRLAVDDMKKGLRL